MPLQLPQWLESDDVSTHAEPHIVWPLGQLLLPPPPPLPGLPDVDGLLQAAAKIAKQIPKNVTRAVFMSYRGLGLRSWGAAARAGPMGPVIPGGASIDRRRA